MRRTLIVAAGVLAAALIPTAAQAGTHPQVPFTGQPPYLLQNTYLVHNATYEGVGVQMKMTTATTTTFVRIDYYNDGGQGFYELQDTATLLCAKEDGTIKDQPIVELACASGHTSTTAQEEEFTLNPSGFDVPSMQTLYEYIGADGILVDYNNLLWSNGSTAARGCGALPPGADCDFDLIGTG